MGLVKEPLNIDFVVDPRPLTIDEEKSISAFIKADKEKRRLKLLKNKPTAKGRTNQLS